MIFERVTTDPPATSRPRPEALKQAALWSIVALCSVAAAGLIAWERCGLRGCPNAAALAAYQPGNAPILLDRHGEFLTELHPFGQKVVPLDSIPDHLIASVITIEDRRFDRHGGVDWVRVLPAAWRGQGASTITMQLARTLYPELLPRQERTLRRKLLEMRIAIGIERHFSKREILELYLNHIYLGRGLNGVASASRRFFDRTPAELSIAQGALLAALVRAPANYDPLRQPDRARNRRDLVIALGEASGRWSATEAERARRWPLGVIEEEPDTDRAVAPYFVAEVRRRVRDEFGSAHFGSPVRIRTTIDPAVQAIAEEELERQLRAIEAGEHGRFDGEPYRSADPVGDEDTDYLQGAISVMDVGNGEILALVGGRDYRHSTFDRATRARRHVGSAFKPFVFATALANGFVASQPIADRPFEARFPGAPPWAPRNYTREFRGRANVRETLVHSINIPTARVAMAVGLDEIVAVARSAGLEGEIPATPATALGAVAVSPLELLQAYSVLATLGERRPARFVRSIEAENGDVLFRSSEEVHEVLDPRIAYILTDILSDVIARGTGARAREAGFHGPAGGKTGTTQDAHDVWFAGYTSELAATVWIGFDRPRPVAGAATGGLLAAPVWGRLMARLHEDRPDPLAWPRPDGIIEAEVDRNTGMFIEEGCPAGDGGTARALFLEERQPIETCPFSASWFDRLRVMFGGSTGAGEDDDGGDAAAPYLLRPESTVEEILGAPLIRVRDHPDS